MCQRCSLRKSKGKWDIGKGQTENGFPLGSNALDIKNWKFPSSAT